MINRIDLLEPELYLLIELADSLNCYDKVHGANSHEESYDKLITALNTLVWVLCNRSSEKNHPEEHEEDKETTRHLSVKYRKMLLEWNL